MAFNPHDEEQVLKAQKQAELKEKQDADDLKFILSSKQGRRFLWRLLAFCGVFRTSFTGNSQTFFNEGQRNVGLRFLNEILKVEPEGLTQMQKESSEVLGE